MKTILALSVLLFLSPAYGQQETEKEIKIVIDQLFDGMRKGDSSMVRKVFHSSASLRSSFIDKKTGQPAMHVEAIQGFLEVIGTPHTEVYDERTANYVYHIDANLAQVWMEYSFYLDGTLLHCGVNSIQLMRLEDGWKITDIADTRRREPCAELPVK